MAVKKLRASPIPVRKELSLTGIEEVNNLSHKCQ